MPSLVELTRFLESTAGITLVSVFFVWSLVWKGFALYRAGKQSQPGWFVALFLINTVGVLEILYLSLFSKRRQRHRRRRS
jgi:methionyl-tRNA synthetase